MTVDPSTFVIQLVLLAVIILAPWFYRRKVRVRFVPLRSKEQVTRHTAVCDRPETGSPKLHPSIVSGLRHCNSPRNDLFLPRAGFISILSPGKPGTPPCKSGQLEKDLELEVSSVRHAARLIILEIMIWIELKPSWCIALTAYCQSRP